jgi:hypothetical protein
MLANPRHSRVLLTNLARGEAPASAGLSARYPGLYLLLAGLELFDISPIVVGESQPIETAASGKLSCSITVLDCDAMSVWRDRRFAESLGSSGTIIFLGGSWLEEDIFIVALQGAERGYEVRLLSDVVLPRIEEDKPFVFDRLSAHGILTATVRQTLLEWAVCLDDPLLTQKVQQLFSKSD